MTAVRVLVVNAGSSCLRLPGAGDTVVGSVDLPRPVADQSIVDNAAPAGTRTSAPSALARRPLVLSAPADLEIARQARRAPA